jgi:hypothetical protein
MADTVGNMNGLTAEEISVNRKTEKTSRIFAVGAQKIKTG